MSDYKNCPFCDEEIKVIAVKCRYCKSTLDEESIKAIESIRSEHMSNHMLQKKDKSFKTDVGLANSFSQDQPVKLEPENNNENLLDDKPKEIGSLGALDKNDYEPTRQVTANNKCNICIECGSEHTRMGYLCKDCDINRAKSWKTKGSQKQAEVQDTIKSVIDATVNSEGAVGWDGGSYTGDLKNGRPHGFGKWIHRTKGKYVGEFCDGYSHGKGKINMPTGDVYEGEYKKGNPDGFGIFYWADGRKYQGEFVNGSPNGKGILVLQNGDTQSGMFRNGVLVKDNSSVSDKDECLIYLDGGVGDIIEVYKNKIIIKHKGALNFLAMGLKGDKTILIKDITSVQLKKAGVVSGYLQFSIPGGKESTAGLFGATLDENTITFSSANNNNEVAEKIKNYIEDRNIALSQPTDSNTQNKISVADELMKLKQLLDDGILNKEEFEIQKQKLLNN